MWAAGGFLITASLTFVVLFVPGLEQQAGANPTFYQSMPGTALIVDAAIAVVVGVIGGAIGAFAEVVAHAKCR